MQQWQWLTHRDEDSLAALLDKKTHAAAGEAGSRALMPARSGRTPSNPRQKILCYVESPS